MNGQTRVALVSSQRLWGGGEQLLFWLGNEMERQGHEVLWIVPRHSVLHENLRQQGSTFSLISGRHPTPSEIMRLRGQLEESGIEVLHANDSHSINWCGAMTIGWMARPRVVGVKHTVFDINSASRYNWLLDRVVCVSQSVRNVCADSGILEDRLDVVYGGMDVVDYDRWDERTKAADALSVSSEMPLLCAVGSLIHCKGYDTLIQSAAALKEAIGDFRLVLCGEGSMRPELTKLIEIHQLQSQVKLLGFCDEPNRWIAAADLFIHPSRSEGLSLVTIAAQMVGTPAIATEVGGLREVMRCYQTSRPLGWIVSPDNSNDLALTMQEALENHEKRQRLSNEARRSALERFSLSRMVAGFLNVYRDTIAERTASSRFKVLRAA